MNWPRDSMQDLRRELQMELFSGSHKFLLRLVSWLIWAITRGLISSLRCLFATKQEGFLPSPWTLLWHLSGVPFSAFLKLPTLSICGCSLSLNGCFCQSPFVVPPCRKGLAISDQAQGFLRLSPVSTPFLISAFS